MAYAKPEMAVLSLALAAIQGTAYKHDPSLDFARDDRSTSPAYEADE